MKKILNLLFPGNCAACGLRLEGLEECLCSLCRSGICWIEPPFCDTCGAPADLDYAYPTETFQCGLCRKNTYRFDRARSLGTYDSVLKDLIHYFKYQQQPGAIREIRSLLECYWVDYTGEYEGFEVLAVPLHFNKLKERGFDQSYLLAEAVSGILDLPILTRVLERIRETPPQARRTRAERAENIRGAFQVRNQEQVRGKSLLVVDDVFTTGSTANEVARVLKQHKAERVHVFTLARA